MALPTISKFLCKNFVKSHRFLFLGFVTLIVIVVIFSGKGHQHLRAIKQLVSFSEKTNNDVKTILYWNPYYFTADYSFGFGREPFLNHCVINNCYVTNNRSYQSLDKFDAVLIHGPLFYPMKADDIPSVRSPHQHYVLLSHECPTKFPGHDGFPDLINMTMTYRLDSDIFVPYFRFYDVNDEYVGPKLLPQWNQPIHDTTYLTQFLDIYERKSKPIAWIYSNCRDAFNMRNEYVSELQKYISVDIYGLCGKNNCPREGNMSCYNQIKNDYFFYLAFENPNCVDYVTEKLHTAMNYEAIPVTLNTADMTRIAPPYTFVDARKHEPKELAKYLKFLMENPMEYLKYHWWRKTYYMTLFQIPDPHCRLCEFLNTKHVDTYTSYTDYQLWYRGSAGNQICTNEILENNPYIPKIDPDTDFEVKSHADGIALQ